MCFKANIEKKLRPVKKFNGLFHSIHSHQRGDLHHVLIRMQVYCILYIGTIIRMKYNFVYGVKTQQTSLHPHNSKYFDTAALNSRTLANPGYNILRISNSNFVSKHFAHANTNRRVRGMVRLRVRTSNFGVPQVPKRVGITDETCAVPYRCRISVYGGRDRGHVTRS